MLCLAGRGQVTRRPVAAENTACFPPESAKVGQMELARLKWHGVFGGRSLHAFRQACRDSFG